MALSELRPAERHRQIAAGFTDRVHGARDHGVRDHGVRDHGVRSWDARSPVAGWTARDVVRHLVEWVRPFLAAGADVTLPPVPGVDDDPVAAWRGHRDAIQALLDDPQAPQRSLVDPHIGELPLDQAIDRFYTTDVFMHTWDLARATGQDDRLDPDQCAVLLAGMEPVEDLIRASGQYGPRVPVPDSADVQARLLGFIGRDPGWTPA